MIIALVATISSISIMYNLLLYRRLVVLATLLAPTSTIYNI